MTDDQRRNDPNYKNHPRILDYFIDRVKADAKAGKHVSAFAPDDGAPICTCDLCKKMSSGKDIGYGAGDTADFERSISQEWFYFINNVMDGVNKEYPDHLLATNGYSNRFIPPNLPNFNQSKSLVLMFADIGACTIHGYDDPKCWQMQQQFAYLKRWCQLCDKVWIYNYNYTMLVGKSTIVPTTRRVERDLPALKDIGVLGFFDQDDADMSMTGIPTYVMRNALEWNAHADAKAILSDFYAKWYGPAADPMRTFYTALENAIDNAPYHAHEDPILPPIYTTALMAKLDASMHAAEQAAGAEPAKSHVRVDRLIYDHLCDYVAAQTAKNDGKFAEAARLMQHMLALKAEMNAVTPFFGWSPYPVYNAKWEAERMTRLDAKVNGTQGELVTMMPLQAKFRVEPVTDQAIALFGPTFDDAKWQSISTITGWPNQPLLNDNTGKPLTGPDGHTYRGAAWYRFMVDLPAAAQGKTLILFAPALLDKASVWVNGQLVGETKYMQPWFRPQELEMDISRFAKPGEKNQITLRVVCNDDNSGANGIYERMFIYAKK